MKVLYVLFLARVSVFRLMPESAPDIVRTKEVLAYRESDNFPPTYNPLSPGICQLYVFNIFTLLALIQSSFNLFQS